MTARTCRARAALRKAMQKWREPLVSTVFLPEKQFVPPWDLAASEAATDSETIFWLDRGSRRWGLEAAALFALLARVDLALWKELTRELWPTASEWADFIDTRASLRVGLDMVVLHDDHALTCACLNLRDYLNAQRSRKYHDTRALMAQVARIPVESLPVVPMRIDFIVDPAIGADTSSAFFATLLIDICRSLESHTSGKDTTLRLTRFRIDTDEFVATDAVLQHLVGLQALGIQVTDIPSLQIDTQDVVAERSVQTIRTLLETKPSPVDTVPYAPYVTRSVATLSARPRVAHGAEKISLTHSLPPPLVPRMFSAVHASSSLRAVDATLDYSDASSRQSFVQWLAFGLFCRCPLSSVELDVRNLSTQDLEWVCEVVTAANPLAVLFPGHPNAGNLLAEEVSNVLLYDPHDAANANQVALVDDTPTAYPILSDRDHTYVTVLLPGWGRAWVLRESATITARVDPPTVQSPSRIVFRSMCPEGMDALLTLLRLLGPTLKHLEIARCEYPAAVFDAFCEQAIRACPNLHALNLSNHNFTDFETVLNASRAKQLPNLTQLSLEFVNVHDGHALQAVFQELANCRSAMAIRLRTFRVTLFEDSSPHTTAMLEAALAMLETNTRVRDFAIKFHHGPDLTSYAPRFQSHNLSQAIEPLPQRSILAFHSIISKQCEDAALKRFDSHMLGHILAFAASRRIRTVDFVLE